jgi:hypothetical protein
MGSPVIENATPFAFEPLFLSDEEARPLLVPLLKATYSIGEAGLAVAEEQVPVELAGQFHGEPGASSYRIEPECAFVKPATDVVLIGQAHPAEGGATEMLVAFQVGPVRKGVRVLGDRVFFQHLGGVGISKPAPLQPTPLVWERAFGGWDRRHADPARHACEPRNPVGVGFRCEGSPLEDGAPLPNLEDPAEPILAWGQRVTPAGFGFVSPHWQPRAAWAGTYDAAWESNRAPLLPRDFDRRFMNGSPPGLTAQGYLKGDEPVAVTGASPDGRLAFRLPGLPPPEVRASFAVGPDRAIPMWLDTVVVDTDASQVLLLWRGSTPLREGPRDVRSISVACGPFRRGATAGGNGT